MASTPYLFEEMNREPYRSRRRRSYAFSPEVREALARLEKALDAIPPREWEVRKRRWDELQRELKNQRTESKDEIVRKRSAALMPGKKPR